MLHKLEGIVLRQIRYSDTSRIVITYTRQEGKVALFLNGVGKSKKSNATYLLQPLSVVEFVIHRKSKGKAMGIIKESKVVDSSLNIHQSMFKTGIALFMAEVLNKSIGEEEGNPELYEFARECISCLEQLDSHLNNFPLQFTIKLSSYLGFYPDDSGWAAGTYFDLMEGEFNFKQPLHRHCLDTELSESLKKALDSRFGENTTLSHQTRTLLMEKMLEYYALHLPNFADIKSHHVLKEVLA